MRRLIFSSAGIGFCLGFGIRLVISLVVIPVSTALIDFAFPVTFAIDFLGLVASVGVFFWTSSGGFTWGTSGVVWMPSEDINRLEFDCIVFGVSVCAGGVICSIVSCGVTFGPGMVFTLSAFGVRCVRGAGGLSSLANSWNWDGNCSMPGLVNFLLAGMFIFCVWAFV